MQTLGERLRAEREKKGLSIAELADRTRIRAHYFEAIEADRPEEFPGPFFYRSFLRQYAGLLGLPDAAVREELDRSLADEQSAKVEVATPNGEFRPQVAPMPTGRINVREETRRWMIRLSGLIGVLVLCSGVYFFWQRWGQHLFDEGWRAVTTHAAQPAPQKAATKPSAPPAQNAAQQPAAASDAANGTQPAGDAATKVDAPPPGVQPHGEVEIKALGDCWLSGWRDGRQFLAVTMHAGDARIVQGGGAVRLEFGNAGNVALKIDGQALAPIGGKGEPRTLEYNNGAYRLKNRVPTEQRTPPPAETPAQPPQTQP